MVGLNGHYNNTERSVGDFLGSVAYTPTYRVSKWAAYKKTNILLVVDWIYRRVVCG
jgi:hypothetical protein